MAFSRVVYNRVEGLSNIPKFRATDVERTFLLSLGGILSTLSLGITVEFAPVAAKVW